VVAGDADQVLSPSEQLSQHMLPVVQACNKEKEVIKEGFLLVRSDLDILEGRIRTKQARLEGVVSGVWGKVMIQQAIIDEVRVAITLLQNRHNMIVSEAAGIFQGIQQQISDMVKKLTTNGSTLVAATGVGNPPAVRD